MMNIRGYFSTFVEYTEWFVLRLRIGGMNLFVYWECMKWICMYTENMQNEVNLWMEFCCAIHRICRMNLFAYRDHMEWICLCTENMRNKSVHIVRIRGIHEYLSKLRTKIKNTLLHRSGAQMGYLGQTTF
jgi:hypothetical protein